MALNSIRVNFSLVEEIVGCLLTCDPGLSCGLVKRFISPGNSCPNHYVGVYLDDPSGTQFPSYADDTSRFVWNFLADRTAASAGNRSLCSGKCNDESEVCVGAEVEGGGRCVVSTTRYAPAYSTRVKYEGNVWHVLPANSSDLMSAADPVWTESFWNTIGLRVYAVQSTAYDWVVLLAGVSITAASYLAVIIGRTYISKPARVALKSGCEGVSAINTIMSVMGINLKTLRPEPCVEGYSTPGGYSARAVHPIALAKVMQIARMMKEEFTNGQSLSAIGGVETGNDAAEFILLGADTVQVCTGVMMHGYPLVKKLCTELQDFMREHNFSSIEDFRGVSLPYFTTHTDLVQRQQEAIKQRKAIRKGLQSDKDWTGDGFVKETESMVSN